MMSTSKRLTFFLSLILLFSFAVTGCSSQPVTSDVSPEVPMNLTFIGASATGPGVIIMNGLAECVSKSYPDSIVTITPGNSGTNVIRINKSEADAAITDTFFVVAAVDGKAPFEEKMDNLAAVAQLYPASFHLVVNKDLGINSLDEIIKNKVKIKISGGLAGGASDTFFQQLLAEYDLTVDDINNWGGEVLNQNISNSVEMLTDNRIDAMVMGAFVPTPNIQELSKNKEIVLLEIEPQVIDSMCKKYGYSKSVFPAGAYDFQKGDLPCINSNTVFIVPKNSSEENVYKITRSIYENLDYLKLVHSSMVNETAADLVNNLGIPLHPGAEKFYREKGLIK